MGWAADMPSRASTATGSRSSGVESGSARPSGSIHRSSPSGTSGSRNATLRCTGPDDPTSVATEMARATTERQ